MRKFTNLAVLLLLFFSLQLTTVFAQSPKMFKYQTVVRNSAGAIIQNQAVAFRISLLQGSATGTAAYSETQSKSTNDFGLVNLEIGNGIIVSGAMNTINWANGPYFVKVELDISNGTNYITMGTSELLSVPYALYAEKAGSGFSGNYNDLTNKPVLSISNDTIFLTSGGFVKLPSSATSTLLPPTISIQAATNLQYYSATLKGSVNAHNFSTSVVFEWGSTTSYGNTAIVSLSPVTGSTTTQVVSNLTGLQPNNTYHYRLKATNAIDVTYSNDMTFSTPSFNFAPNTSIIGLNSTHATGVIQTITSDIIIKGKIIANDESGNLYKCIYIEDDSAGLQIMLNLNNLYTTYKLGQRVFIKCKGLALGDNGGNIILGVYSSSYNLIQQIPADSIPYHIFLDSLVGSVPLPINITISSLSLSKVNMLVKLDSVFFADYGQPYSNSTQTTMRQIFDQNGNSIYLRTSNYALFANKIIPSGMGSVTGILAIYNGVYQLYIRDTNDVAIFSNVAFILNENFATATLGSFTQYSVTGTEYWQTGYPSYSFAKMSGYSGGYNPNEDWLISPAMNLSLCTNLKLRFLSAMKWATAADNSMKFYFSTNYISGNPTTATWTEFTVANLPLGTDWTFVPSGVIDLSTLGATGSNVHIAFKYTSTSTVAATWEFTNIVITGIHN